MSKKSVRHTPLDSASRPSRLGSRTASAAPSEEVRSVAAYLAHSSEELIDLARAAHLDFLAYLLGIARLEAERMAASRH